MRKGRRQPRIRKQVQAVLFSDRNRNQPPGSVEPQEEIYQVVGEVGSGNIYNNLSTVESLATESRYILHIRRKIPGSLIMIGEVCMHGFDAPVRRRSIPQLEVEAPDPRPVFEGGEKPIDKLEAQHHE